MENFEVMPPMWSVPKSYTELEYYGKNNQFVSFSAGSGLADIEHLAHLMKSTELGTTQLGGLVMLWDSKRLNARKRLEDELLELRKQKELARIQQAELLKGNAGTASSVQSWKETTDKLGQLLYESMVREKQLLKRVEDHNSAHDSQNATQETQEQLERVDSFLHFVLKNAPLVMNHQDKEHRHRLVYNQFPKFQDILGKTSGECMQRAGTDLSSTLKLDELKKPFTTEVTYSSNDSSFGTKTFSWFVEPVMNKADEILGVNVIGMDITDLVAKREKLATLREEAAVQRAIQNELHKTLGLTEETSRAKQLLATMSHEIRSPLSGVMGMLDILSTTKLDPEQQKLVNVMTNSGEVVLQVINDILDLSKYESGALKLEEKGFKLRDLVKSVLQVAAVSAQEKKISLEGFVDGDVPLEIVGDCLRIRQLLVNLVSNGIKFTSKGTVKLSVTTVSMEAAPAETSHSQLAFRLQFEVADTGIGIPESDFPFLFNMYMQTSTTYARDHGRTGLGLAICKELVERMGGELKVSSTVNKGSRFSFSLPLKNTNRGTKQKDERFVFAPRAAEPTHSTEESQILRKAKILLVDDSTVNITVTRNMLKRLGAEFEVATNGKAAVEAATSKNFDLILMDLCLPVLDGMEATRLIREYEQKASGSSQCSSKRTAIVAMTANSIAEKAAQCYAHGMDSFIAKPFKLGKLKQVLLELLPQQPDSSSI